MSGLKSLFKQTFIYGLATVLPRMLSFLLVPLYTTKGVLSSVAEYGKVSIIFSWFVIFNVLLAYGMETAFFRFFNKEDDQDKVVGTSGIALVFSSFAFFALALLFQNQIAEFTNINVEFIRLVIWILLLDALVIIPFAWLRANSRSMTYAIVKIMNVAVNLGLNVFFLIYLKKWAVNNDFIAGFYRTNFEINYIFISNLVASALTLILMSRFYLKMQYRFDKQLFKQMFWYAFPVLIAGLAFSINETFDRILLDYLLPDNIAETKVGMYSACYKIAIFMTLFATAYRLGIEPYFFSHAKTENPQKNYALILEFFVAFGSIMLLTVVVFADVLKPYIVRSEAYWEAMWIVPLILIANLCLGIYHNLSVWYKVTDRTKYGAYISVFGAFITLGLNFLLIPIMEYRGSAIATLVAYASMMVASYYYGQKYYPIPYNLKKMALYLVLSSAFSIVSFYVYRENYVVGISLLMIFLLLVVRIEKNQIKHLLKTK
ncbi:MAG TPA: oligosaccharide flippase family protein [Gelidibacter sp.]|uniref:oligosaccharide flippase family protein n=1 Tax=Gelidibacter sp. TaxID=2018083 RepID=UPI002BBBFBC4|nr:oligosaccharide flippase family protein [Gelidibacter sp.]HXJ98896.1 oligosaccharide flippase family protein [Gelidibacter sp.]